MVRKQSSPKKTLSRVHLLMQYDTSKTFTENKINTKKLISEDSVDTDVEKSVQKVLQACKDRPEAEGSLNAAAIASSFNRAFNYQTAGIFGGTDDSLWRQQAENMKKGNMDDLCNVDREFADLGFGNLALKLVDELDDEELSEIMETFSAMQYNSKKQSKLAVDKTEQFNINWFKKNYPCIFQSNGNVDQKVYTDQNNYVYILIKGTSNNQYQVFADGRVKKQDGTATGKKVSCSGSKVTFINESIEKKNVFEQIDDSSLIGGKPSPNPDPSPDPKPKPKPRPIPSELATVDGIKVFQDWLDENHPGWATGYTDGIIKKGANGGGYGTFGPRTSKAWISYKDDYLSGKNKPTPDQDQDQEVKDVDTVDY